MALTPTELDKLMQLIADKAKNLREAGVSALTIGDVRIELRDPDPPAPELDLSDDEPELERDLLKDPDTFGGRIPRRRGADGEVSHAAGRRSMVED